MTNKVSTRLLSSFLDYRKALEKMLANIVRPCDVEDIVQETWVRVAKAELKHKIEYPKSFIYQTAKHLAFDHQKRAENRLVDSISDQDIDALCETRTDSIYEEVEASEKFEWFCRAVRTLPPCCRRAFILKKVYGYSQREIAQYMNISQSAVEKHIAKGTLMCADYMRSNGVLSDSTDKNSSSKEANSVGGN